MFDYNKMLNDYTAMPAYSAKAEQDAEKQAKQAAKQAKQIPTFAGCGNHSCRICYNVVQRVAVAIKPELKTREQILKETLDDLRKMQSDGEKMERQIDAFEQEFAALKCELRNHTHVI